jgi:outer membrane protein
MPVEIGTTANGVAVYSDQTLPSSYKTEDYGTQLDNNLSRSLTLQLNIPVFNNFTTRTNIAKAKLQREKTAYDLELEKQNLRKIIQSAYADARAAKNQYLSAKTKLEATREAFNYAEKKFNVGLITSVEYNDAKKELTNAKSELLSAKYQFVFTRTVLDFYLGNPIKLQN